MTLHSSAVLVVAHPGHELRLHGWLEQARPHVLVLTDGSGRNESSRIAAASAYLATLDLPPGPLFGRYTDRVIYDALLKQDLRLFIALADELAAFFVCACVDFVVGDATEGYNTTHDVCRLVLDAAVAMAGRARGRALVSYDFPVVRRPDDCPADLRAQAVWLNLPDEVFARKLAAARRHYPELLAEVESALAHASDGPLRAFLELNDQFGSANGHGPLDQFRIECLRPTRAADAAAPTPRPFYELHSERLVAAGHYQQVIRYHEHIRPLALALAAHAG
ncbi:MAG: hypothetical protein ACJ74W_13945 [Pyrinomonadaceae bacterium]